MMPATHRLALALLSAILFALMLWPFVAHGEDAISNWFKSQHNANGLSCCDLADGHRFDGDYGLNQDGSATLYLEDGSKRQIPPAKVLKGPNPTGHAIYWYVEGISGNIQWRTDYCFIPGPLM